MNILKFNKFFDNYKYESNFKVGSRYYEFSSEKFDYKISIEQNILELDYPWISLKAKNIHNINFFYSSDILTNDNPFKVKSTVIRIIDEDSNKYKIKGYKFSVTSDEKGQQRLNLYKKIFKDKIEQDPEWDNQYYIKLESSLNESMGIDKNIEEQAKEIIKSINTWKNVEKNKFKFLFKNDKGNYYFDFIINPKLDAKGGYIVNADGSNMKIYLKDRFDLSTLVHELKHLDYSVKVKNPYNNIYHKINQKIMNDNRFFEIRYIFTYLMKMNSNLNIILIIFPLKNI